MQLAGVPLVLVWIGAGVLGIVFSARLYLFAVTRLPGDLAGSWRTRALAWLHSGQHLPKSLRRYPPASSAC